MTNQKTETKKAPPVARIRVTSVEGTIWENQTEKGNFRKAKFRDSYRTKDGWKSTDGFDIPGCLALAHAALKAADKLIELRAEELADEARGAPQPEDYGDGDDEIAF
jgi:hypothetical protein